MTDTPNVTTPEPQTPVFTQDIVNSIVKKETNKIAEKFADYETIKQELDTYKKQQESLKQQDLEAKGEYEKAKETWSSREKEYQTKLSDKDNAINDMRIKSALTSEVIKLNAHADVVDLIRGKVEVDAQGNVFIKGKDANGMDTNLSVEVGMKQFLGEKPYLLKANNIGGSGTTPTNDSVGASGSDDDLPSLNNKLAKAMTVGDSAEADRISKLIKQKMAR